MKCNEQAAGIHDFMCFDPRYGYTQGPYRWGNRTGEKTTVKVGQKKYILNVGDFDCSSSTIYAWRKALEGTKFEGLLNSATYTGDMKSVFLRSGLFEWKPMSFVASPGDLYLNEIHHVGMCQSQIPDKISEFLSNEFGGSTGGQPGDQTGGESINHDFWWPRFDDGSTWEGILHYNGKADIPDLPDALKDYTDLDPEAWYIPYVEKAVKNKWMTGAYGQWNPNDPMSRAMGIVSIGKKDKWDISSTMVFEDIGTWYTSYILKAADLGIVDKTNHIFNPEKRISREDFITFLWRSMGSPSCSREPYKEASPWARVAVAWAIEKGIVIGSPRPSDILTRAEAAAMLCRI